MHKLIEGIHQFQTTLFGSHRELFERLAEGQSPETLFITCSDSRINPNLLTQTEPGELFILRNAGNIVPPYGAAQGGEAATIEFAVAGLDVKDIIVCGHSHCGAMKGLLEPPPARDFPALTQWLSHAESTRRIVRDKYAGREAASLLNVTIQENVLAQMENLRTHPVVASGLAQGKLKLHGWVYKIETGEVFGYDPASGQFLPLGGQRPPTTERKQSAVEI
jgi:carbonic anhydrase